MLQGWAGVARTLWLKTQTGRSLGTLLVLRLPDALNGFGAFAALAASCLIKKSLSYCAHPQPFREAGSQALNPVKHRQKVLLFFLGLPPFRRAAERRGIPIVSPQWLHDCEALGVRQPEANYPVHRPAAPQPPQPPLLVPVPPHHSLQQQQQQRECVGQRTGERPPSASLQQQLSAHPTNHLSARHDATERAINCSKLQATHLPTHHSNTQLPVHHNNTQQPPSSSTPQKATRPSNKYYALPTRDAGVQRAQLPARPNNTRQPPSSTAQKASQPSNKYYALPTHDAGVPHAQRATSTAAAAVAASAVAASHQRSPGPASQRYPPALTASSTAASQQQLQKTAGTTKGAAAKHSQAQPRTFAQGGVGSMRSERSPSNQRQGYSGALDRWGGVAGSVHLGAFL